MTGAGYPSSAQGRGAAWPWCGSACPDRSATRRSQCPGIGTQIRDHATIGFVPEADVQLTWDEQAGAYEDGTPYSLRSPRVSITMADGQPLSADVLRSLRAAPPVFGRGLLEALPDDALLALADPDDVNGDGISGRVNWVFDAVTHATRIGRFGVKANTATLFEQSAAAYLADMGVSTPMFPEPDGSFELDFDTLDAVTFYIRTLAVPTAELPVRAPRAARRCSRLLAARRVTRRR